MIDTSSIRSFDTKVSSPEVPSAPSILSLLKKVSEVNIDHNIVTAFMDKKGALVVANAKNNPDQTSVNVPLKDSFNESRFQNSEKDNDILKQDSSILYSYGGRNSNNVDLRELQECLTILMKF